MSLVDSDDDWIESFRRTWYPRLHPHLTSFGDKIGVTLYAKGRVHENQYVLTLPAGEETSEEVLSDLGFERNPIAAYKTHPDGRQSEGSWRLRHKDDQYGLVEEGMQLHITFLRNHDVDEYVDVYAHYEDDWMASPLNHLQEKNFSAQVGSEMAQELIENETYLDWYDKNDA